MADRFGDAASRRRLEDLEAAMERQGRSAADNGAAALLVQTAVKAAYPAAAQAVYYCAVLRAVADPVEGAVATFPATGRHLYAANQGGRVPPVGTKLIAVRSGGLWTIRYD